jgi:hypothetical protein
LEFVVYSSIEVTKIRAGGNTLERMQKAGHSSEEFGNRFLTRQWELHLKRNADSQKAVGKRL